MKTNNIIADRKLGLTYEQLASKYQCSKSTISNALKFPGLTLIKKQSTVLKKNTKQYSTNIKFGIRFYSWLGKNLGIKGYSKMNLKQLKHSIAQELLKT